MLLLLWRITNGLSVHESLRLHWAGGAGTHEEVGWGGEWGGVGLWEVWGGGGVEQYIGEYEHFTSTVLQIGKSMNHTLNTYGLQSDELLGLKANSRFVTSTTV